eukprot:augustus_masked-scaffold_2-processed-gene-2.31-mRNA-1 protein AED:1.00 eAED:1.00 QI:0/-1/0/0/-1/1/1/0/306
MMNQQTEETDLDSPTPQHEPTNLQAISNTLLSDEHYIPKLPVTVIHKSPPEFSSVEKERPKKRKYEAFSEERIMRYLKKPDENYIVDPKVCVKAWRKLEKMKGTRIMQRERSRVKMSVFSKYYIYYEHLGMKLAKCLLCGKDDVKRKLSNTNALMRHREICNDGVGAGKNFSNKDAQHFVDNDAALKLDFMDVNNAYLLRVDVGNVKKEKCSVYVEHDILCVSIDFGGEEDEKANGEVNFDIREEMKEEFRYLIRERNRGVLKRNLKLPEDFDIEGVNAKVENQVLEVSILKKETQAPKKSFIMVS